MMITPRDAADGGKGAATLTRVDYALERHDIRIVLARGKQAAGKPLSRTDRYLLASEDVGRTPEKIVADLDRIASTAKRASTRVMAMKLLALLTGDIATSSVDVGRVAEAAAAGAALGSAQAAEAVAILAARDVPPDLFGRIVASVRAGAIERMRTVEAVNVPHGDSNAIPSPSMPDAAGENSPPPTG